MPGLTPDQIAAFRRDGFITAPNAVSAEQLANLNAVLAGWVDDSRQHKAAFGQMMDGRPRFDVEPGHNADTPGLRRVASPTEISDLFAEIAFDSRMTDMAADLVGPDTRFHHAKVNSKLPNTKTVVKWHQDFPFDPHSNDDTLTALLFLDDVTMDKGPLMVAPGSHKGPLHSHYQNGRFTGAVSDELSDEFAAQAVPCCGPAGAVCLMHSRVAHASSANQSADPRNLYIVTYAAADAAPLAPLAVPSVHAGMIVRGAEPGRIRSQAFDIETPEIPKGASFFVQQEGAD